VELGVLKRSQRQVADSSRHWYQDKYQHVLVQRNLLALITLVAMGVALVAVFTVARLAPQKSVEPYLLQIEEKTGITQKVEPITKTELANNDAVNRYFVAQYVRAREGYNPTIRIYNDNLVRVMSNSNMFYQYRRTIDPANEASLAARLGGVGQRTTKINSMQYITNPVARGESGTTPERIMQVRFTTTNIMPNAADVTEQWIATITFVYADIELNETERLLNPIGFRVVNYQVEREIA
jgi:type IV secretion system protein VirB8